jgi:hypothetical protein
MARGHSYLWTPWLVWTQVLTNAVIGLTLMVIAGSLWRRRGVAGVGLRHGVLAAFAFLLGACHLLDVWVTWSPAYGVDAVVRTAATLAGLVAMIALARGKG